MRMSFIYQLELVISGKIQMQKKKERKKDNFWRKPLLYILTDLTFPKLHATYSRSFFLNEYINLTILTIASMYSLQVSNHFSNMQHCICVVEVASSFHLSWNSCSWLPNSLLFSVTLFNTVHQAPILKKNVLAILP